MTAGPDDVHQALDAFDGKHVAPLEALAKSGVSEAGWHTLLAALPGAQEVAATWVVKDLVTRGEGRSHLGEVLARLPELTEGDAILHVLQSVQFAPEAATGLADHFLHLLGHRKTLARVWALDALARIDPGHAAPHVQAALEDPSAAMRARARALRKTVTK